MTSAIEGQIAFEHFHRYCLARDLVVGRDVLDIASGEGYGAAILAGTARSVVGVEIDAASVEHARAAYPLPNLRFEQGDALRLPLPDDCLDVVTSFETLEHLADHEGFLAEIRRVLRPGGVCLLSFSNRCFPSKAVAAWLGASDAEHVRWVGGLLRCAGFARPQAYDLSPAPKRSDPLFVVSAVKALA
jgi:ubiquinone/menaquinone biosynthesis C-methylase UbiE